jgi:hypothetical protein
LERKRYGIQYEKSRLQPVRIRCITGIVLKPDFWIITKVSREAMHENHEIRERVDIDMTDQPPISRLEGGACFSYSQHVE